MEYPADTDTCPLSSEEIARVREAVYSHYRKYRRRFPWRETTDPYCILVSEVMLQQTGVERVMVHYPPFISSFPGFSPLAEAPLAEVLRAWKGLGYNRRALNLHKTARIVTDRHGGILPAEEKDLLSLPGIGKATAASIRAFAYNMPSVFVETNIRRLFLHWFFPVGERIPDSTIIPLVRATLDRENPADWYYALMDFGAHLRSVVPDTNRRSAHYHRQAPFRGSDREIRGRIISVLLHSGRLDQSNLPAAVMAEGNRVRAICDRMAEEGLIVREGEWFRLP
ncbi:MAG: A/G-specific adenine glycosylase [Methanolinea sp.]|jgi:A/G-specific adenine glycosylase|nr:A/G-specific adenine glycosylase [Methanolinea sp.]